MYWIVCVFAYLVSYLPEKLINIIAQILTWLAHDVFRIRRKIIYDNLDLCYSNELTSREKLNIAKGAWFSLFRTSMEVLRFIRIDETFLQNNVSFEGVENLTPILEKKRGTFFVTLHMGNWELMGSSISNALIPVVILAQPIRPPWLNRLIVELRARAKVKVLDTKNERDIIVLKILRALKDNYGVGFAFDQYRTGDIKVPFFGVKTRTNSTLAILAEKTKRAVVPMYCTRTTDHKFKVTFLKEVQMDFSGDPDQNMEKNTTIFNEIIERIIREHPEQWLWMHKRWR